MEIINGLIELHNLGFNHSNMRPENVVIDLEPFEVRLINFRNSNPLTQSTFQRKNSEFPYCSDRLTWSDGSRKWDIYALSVMILESMNQKDFSFNFGMDSQI